MSSKGIKGPMGLPVFQKIPSWAVDIVDFRNQQYQRDIMGPWQATESVDRAYDKIDSAIGKMMESLLKKDPT